MNKEEKNKLINLIEAKYGEMNSYIFANLNEAGYCNILYFGHLVNLTFIEKSISMALTDRLKGNPASLPTPPPPLKAV